MDLVEALGNRQTDRKGLEAKTTLSQPPASDLLPPAQHHRVLIMSSNRESIRGLIHGRRQDPQDPSFPPTGSQAIINTSAPGRDISCPDHSRGCNETRWKNGKFRDMTAERNPHCRMHLKWLAAERGGRTVNSQLLEAFLPSQLQACCCLALPPETGKGHVLSPGCTLVALVSPFRLSFLPRTLWSHPIISCLRREWKGMCELFPGNLET